MNARRRRTPRAELLAEPPERVVERERLPSRPFRCVYCPARFADLEALAAHRDTGCGPAR